MHPVELQRRYTMAERLLQGRLGRGYLQGRSLSTLVAHLGELRLDEKGREGRSYVGKK